MITGSIIGHERVIAKMQRFQQAVQEALRPKVQSLAIELEQHIKQGYLSGQALNVRTGRLRRSINHDITQATNQIIAKVGTNVKYARPWELGFQGPVTVREHLRRTPSGGETTVAQHIRNVVMRPRPFLVPALRDKKPRITRVLASAIPDAAGKA